MIVFCNTVKRILNWIQRWVDNRCLLIDLKIVQDNFGSWSVMLIPHNQGSPSQSAESS